jgi:hypothetical protein
LLEVSTYLKKFELLTNPVLRVLAGHIKTLDKMNPNQLSLYTMIYLSSEMANAVTISAEQIE